nr:XRE family transcriptional regulator [Paraburkholderia sp. Ac-20340]
MRYEYKKTPIQIGRCGGRGSSGEWLGGVTQQAYLTARYKMELLDNQWQAGTNSLHNAGDLSSVIDRVLIIAYRKKKKESQRRFWARFGVTQSRGSRFESGAEIPPPVSILLGLYFNKTISDGDLGRAERVLRRPELPSSMMMLSPGQ